MANAPRVSSVPGEPVVPEVAMGYCFLAKDGSDATLIALVIEDRNSRAILAASGPLQRAVARRYGRPG
eukprot:13014395-Alexandrium_andersonii.AAC.1